MVAMTIDDRGTRIAHAIALLVFALMFALPCAAQEKFRFLVGESSKTLSYGPLWVAAKMGFFERESLDVPIITMRGSPLTIQALTADSIYVASAGVDTLISAYERGADLTMIGGLINGLGLSLIGGKPYKTYADLRGTTIGSQTITSGTGFALRLVLKAHGLEYPRDYKLLNIGGASERFQALTSGQISSAPVGVPLDLVAKQQGFNIIGYFADDQPNFQFNGYFVKRSWAEKNRALVVRFMKAMASTMRWMMRQSRGRLRLFIEGNGDQHRTLPLRRGLQLEKPHLGSQRRFEFGRRTHADQSRRRARDSQRAPARTFEVHRSELSQSGAGGNRKKIN